MELKTYLLSEGVTQVALAERLGVTQGAVQQWAAGRIAVAPERCIQIEMVTEGLVTRKDLRPVDWHRIWPELATTTTNQQPAGQGV